MSINRMKHLAGLCEAKLKEELTPAQLERFCERYIEDLEKECTTLMHSNKDVTWEMAHDELFMGLSDANPKDNSSASTQIFIAMENVLAAREELLVAYEKLIKQMKAI